MAIKPREARWGRGPQKSEVASGEVLFVAGYICCGGWREGERRGRREQEGKFVRALDYIWLSFRHLVLSVNNMCAIRVLHVQCYN